MTRQSTTGPLATKALSTRTRLIALGAILCATATLAGCSSGDDTTVSESTAPTSAASTAPVSPAPPADPEAVVKKTALEVYQGYWREMQAYYADRNGTTAGLKQYAASEALASAENDAEHAHGRGRIYIGPVIVSESTVTGTDLASKTPKVMLSSCLVL